MTVSTGARWFNALTAPSSVAVVGANERRESFSGAVIPNLQAHGFQGKIYPVNPGRDSVNGIPAHASLEALPEVPECFVCVVSADLALDTVEVAGHLGIPAGIVVASGFTEGGGGAVGEARAERLRAILRDSPTRILGPSTTGLISLTEGFVPRAALNQLAAQDATAGTVALISQSGACANIVYGQAQLAGLPIGLAVSTGLQLDLNAWDWLEQVLVSSYYTTVLFLLEELGSAERWVPLMEDARRRGVAVVLCKAGRSQAGAQAAATHTGSVAGDWEAESRLLRGLGVLLADSLEDLWLIGQLCHAWGPPPDRPGRTVGVLAMSGGEGALLADQASALDLSLPALPSSIVSTLTSKMTLGEPANPLDPTGAILGDPVAAADLASAFVRETEWSAYLVASPGLDIKLAREVSRGALSAFPVPDRAVAVSGWAFDPRVFTTLRATGLPVFARSSDALRSISAYLGSALRVREPWAENMEASGQPVTSGIPTYVTAMGLVEKLGLRVPPGRLVSTIGEALEAAAQVGYPVVLKANVPSIVHKSAANQMVARILGAEDLRAAWKWVRESWDGDMSLEAHVVGDVEVLLGARMSPTLGRLAVFGSGGSRVEETRDLTVLCIDHVGVPTVADLLETRVGRSIRSSSTKALEQVVENLGLLVGLLGSDIDVVEVNPAVLDPRTGRWIALDCRIQLSEGHDQRRNASR